MPEILGEGFVQILPEMAQFDALLQAKVAASLASIEKQFAAAGAGGAATVGSSGLGAVGAEASAAGNVVAQKFTPAIKAAGTELDKTAKSAANASTGVSGLSKQFSALARLIPVAIAAFSVKLFSDFEKAAAEAVVVFGDSSKEIVTFAETIDASLRLSSTTALRFATDFGNALQGIGFSEKAVVTVSENLTKRVADTAAALVKSPQQIATAFNLALEGNARGLKQLGITISAVDQSNRAAQLGFHGTIAQLSDAQRAAVFYSLILDKTDKFQGHAAATADTLAGRLGALKAQASDAAVGIGRELSPAVEGVAKVFTGALSVFGSAPKILKDLAISIGLVTVAVSAFKKLNIQAIFVGLLESLQGLGAAFLETAAAEGIFAAATDIALGPVGLLIGAIGVVTAILFTAGHQAENTGTRVKALGDTARTTAENITGFFAGIDLKALNANIDALQTKLDNLKAAAATPPPAPGRDGEPGPTDQGSVRNAIVAQQDLTTALKARKDMEAAVRAAVQAGLVVEAHDAVNATVKDKDARDALNAAIDDEVGKVQAANAKHAESAAILAGDSAALAENTAQVKAQAAAITDLFTVTDQLTKAQRTLKEAQDDLGVAQKRLNDLLAEGGKQEIADARTKIADANDSLTASILRQAEAQKALDDLNAPATERELSDATDAVTLAQIAEAQATRARDDALKALNKTQTKAIDLTHLSLDQLRTTLANARATLAAQRTSTTSTSGATPEETAVTAEIDLRAAKEKVADAQAALLALQVKGTVETDATTHAERELVLAKNATKKAQDEVNTREAALTLILSGNSQYAKDVASATRAVREDSDKVSDAQTTITGLVHQQKVDTSIIAGDQESITNSLKAQSSILENLTLFNQNPALRRSFIENFLESNAATVFGGTLGNPVQVPFVSGNLTPKELDDLFNALKADPTRFRDLLRSLGVTIPGFAMGGLITAPSLAFLGEKFKVESVIPWGQGAARVWDVLAESLPHMPTTVRQRLEPVIPGPTHQISAPTHLNRPVLEIDYKKLGREVAKALKEADVGGGDINVYPTPGMDEARLARKVAREVDRYRGMP